RDDRERDREVLEPAHRAEELLRVAEAMQILLVLGQLGLAGCHKLVAHLAPSRVVAWPVTPGAAQENGRADIYNLRAEGSASTSSFLRPDTRRHASTCPG